MTPADLEAFLAQEFPSELSKDLVKDYIAIRSDVQTGTLERATPGKFVETVVQILQWIEHEKYDLSPKVDDYLKNLESRSSSMSDDLRIVVARSARSMYTMRNKRNIAHKGAVDPNPFDLRYTFGCAQWILSELVRQVSKGSMDTAGQLVERIQLPVGPVVEDFGKKRVVLVTGTAREELLILLRNYYPEEASVTQIRQDMDRRNPSTVSNALRDAFRMKLIDGKKAGGYRLTSLGLSAANQLVAKHSSAQFLSSC